MSRKYIDDHVEFRPNSISDLPTQDNTYYDPGHMFLEPIGGKRFVNEGANDRNSSLFVNDQHNALILHEKLEQLPTITAVVAAKNQNLLIAGTNAANTTVGFNTNGGIKLTTTTSSADQVILIGASTSAWGLTFTPANQVVFETQVVTDTSITAMTIWAGLKLTNTSVVTTDNDQTFFRYQDTVGGGQWQIVDSTANVDNVQTISTSVVPAVAINTPYLLQIKVGEDLIPRYYINMVFVGKGNALTSAAALIAVAGVQTGTTAAKAATYRHLRIVRPRVPLYQSTEGIES